MSNSESSNTVLQFVAELQRRKVLRTVGAYLVGVFIALQVAELILPALAVPEWTFNILVAIAVFLFPIIVVASWVLDVRTEAPQVASGPAGPHTSVTTAGSEARPVGLEAPVAGGQTTAEPPRPAVRPSPAPQPAPISLEDDGTPITSLAILPFANLTGDAGEDYLSDGISESIINKMTRLPGVRVVPRASSFRYRDMEADAARIGADLHVRGIVTGSLHSVEKR